MDKFKLVVKCYVYIEIFFNFVDIDKMINGEILFYW